MKALYAQQNSPGEEMTFVFQERVSSVHQAEGEEPLAECHRETEAQKSCAGLGKDWWDPCTHRQGREGRKGAFCHQAATAGCPCSFGIQTFQTSFAGMKNEP